MKKLIHFAVMIPFISCLPTWTCAQETGEKSVSSVQLQAHGGKKITIDELRDGENSMILFVWTTWCHHSREALTSIQEDYLEDWQADYGVQFVGISIDDARNASKVWPYANGNGWEFAILLDENGDFRRAMGVNFAPHVFLSDGSGTVMWEQQGFTSGDEDLITEMLEKLNNE